jgi:hypothetical protein
MKMLDMQYGITIGITVTKEEQEFLHAFVKPPSVGYGRNGPEACGGETKLEQILNNFVKDSKDNTLVFEDITCGFDGDEAICIRLSRARKFYKKDAHSIIQYIEEQLTF